MGERMAVAVEGKGRYGVMVEGESMLIFFVAVLEVQVLVATAFGSKLQPRHRSCQ